MNNLIPNFIIEQHKLKKEKGSFPAFTMFVDISGFTKLTETLMKHGKEGAEILTDVLNNLFNPMVENIYENQGMISTFAGDAFTGIFGGTLTAEVSPEGYFGNKTPTRDAEKGKKSKENLLDSIIQSALFVNELFVKNKIVSTKFGNFEMGVKVGLSYGKVNWGILGEKGKHTYYFRGDAIDGCAKSEQNANKSDIVIDKSFFNKFKDSSRKKTTT